MSRRRLRWRPGPPSGPGGDWKRFAARLATCLGDLQEKEYLILSSVPGQANYYVQFAAQGRDGMRVEAVSNAYLRAYADDAEARLSAEDCAAMANLGWHHPTYDPRFDWPLGTGSSPNLCQDPPYPVDFRQVARLAVNTLRRVYRIRRPTMLRYKAFDEEGADIRFPAAGWRLGWAPRSTSLVTDASRYQPNSLP